MINSYDRLIKFGQKHLNDLFVLDGIVNVNARDRILREIVSNTLAHRDYSSGFPAKMIIDDEKITLETEDKYGNEEFDEEVLHMRQLLKTKLVDMDLSVRALNCLKSAEVETLGELVQFNKNDLLKFRNFGKKSLTELEALLENNNLEFGMDVAKYKLDKE